VGVVIYSRGRRGKGQETRDKGGGGREERGGNTVDG